MLCRWSLPESMVFTLFGLHTRRPSHDGFRDRCRGKLSFFIYPSNKILIQFSWTHFPYFFTTNGQASADTDKIRNTERDQT